VYSAEVDILLWMWTSGRRTANLAKESAISFPGMPLCPGTHTKAAS